MMAAMRSKQEVQVELERSRTALAAVEENITALRDFDTKARDAEWQLMMGEALASRRTLSAQCSTLAWVLQVPAFLVKKPDSPT
jgi:hypothetical protein